MHHIRLIQSLLEMQCERFHEHLFIIKMIFPIIHLSLRTFGSFIKGSADSHVCDLKDLDSVSVFGIWAI